MESLSKHQLILLALLISFVTSLATGIVTVSLMDQSPVVTRTVSQVIEKTIQQISPQDAAVVSAPTFEDQTAAAVEKVNRSIVTMKSRDGKTIGGMGLVVSKTGVILTDKSVIAKLVDYEAVLSDLTAVPVVVIQSQIDGDVVFLSPITPNAKTDFIPIRIAETPQLGQAVFSLSGTSTQMLLPGIMTEVTTSTGSAEAANVFKASMSSLKILPGSPLFNIKGDVIGVHTSALHVSEASQFYPIDRLRSDIPQVK